MAWIIQSADGKSFWAGRYWYTDKSRAKRWKTAKGAINAKVKLVLDSQQRDVYFRRQQAEVDFLEGLTVVEVPDLEKKFKKKKLTSEECTAVRRKIAETLVARGWKPNRKYDKEIDDLGFSHRWSEHGYLIDPDDRFAITLKSQVLTVHDGSRQFCKVVGMGYNEIKIRKNELVCGRVALKL